MVNRVHIDGLVFDADGTDGFIYTRLTGWLSSPPMRALVESRPNADGAFDVTRDYRAARVITFEGGLVGADAEDAAENFFAAFAAIQGSGAPITFEVERDWGTRSCTVSLQDVAEIEAVGDGLVAAVSAQFVARDPVKYGPEVEYATTLASGGGGLEYELGEGGSGGSLYYGALGNLGRVELVNSGTADVWPVFEITGTLDDGFYLQCLETGQILQYDRVVPAGTTVSIDSRTGQVLVDGLSDASTYLTSDQFFSVPAGGSCTVQFNAISTSSGTPTMTATVRSGWW
jgi:hypothetical protein